MNETSSNCGFFITDRCIACGTCLAVCRENCIAGGRPPFVIRQSFCVRCGLCAARCPVKAIVLCQTETAEPDGLSMA